MAFIARQSCYAFLAAALVLTPAAANAQGNLIQGLIKGLKKEKTAPAAPRKVAPAPSKKAAAKAQKKQPEASKKAQPAPAPLGAGPAP
ncbi:MAG: hypothetical protein V3S27_01945, partial [Kiloniellales bacterium]